MIGFDREFNHQTLAEARLYIQLVDRSPSLIASFWSKIDVQLIREVPLAAVLYKIDPDRLGVKV